MPPGFFYTRDTDASDGSRNPDPKTFLALGSDNQRVGSFSTPASTGTLAITGVGFQPDVIVLMARLPQVGVLTNPARGGVGCASSTAQWAFGINIRYGTEPANFTSWREDACLTLLTVSAPPPGTPVERIRANLISMDADGFTLNFTIQSWGSAITVAYLALQGDYKVGVAGTPTATGLQEISSIGFEPEGLWLMCAGNTAVGMRAGWDVARGFSSNEAQHAIWGGARQSGIPNRSSNRWDDTKAFLLSRGASGSQAEILRARADLDAFLPDSFRLDWLTVDTVSYRYGYLAAATAEAGFFMVDSADPLTGNFVPLTRIEPTSIISSSLGFCFDLAGGCTGAILPETYYFGGRGLLGIGADQPWTDGGPEEWGWGIAQSSGGPSGGGFPDVGVHFSSGWQGRVWPINGTAGDVISAGAGHAFNIYLGVPVEERIPGLNWRYADRHLTSARLLIPAIEPP